MSREESSDAIAAAVGRTITAAAFERDGDDDKIWLYLADGGVLVLRSWDAEGYRSGIHVNMEHH